MDKKVFSVPELSRMRIIRKKAVLDAQPLKMAKKSALPSYSE